LSDFISRDQVRRQLCVEAVTEHLDIDLDAKILDFGAGSGGLGALLAEEGFTNVFAQEGSESKKRSLIRKNLYKDIESFIVGK